MVAAVVFAVSFAQAQKHSETKKGELTNVRDKSAVSRSMVFEKTEVLGYLDGQSPVVILDVGDLDAEPITLNRSFKDALKENSDKETMERLAR
jgi:hypothetical protein